MRSAESESDERRLLLRRKRTPLKHPKASLVITRSRTLRAEQRASLRREQRAPDVSGATAGSCRDLRTRSPGGRRGRSPPSSGGLGPSPSPGAFRERRRSSEPVRFEASQVRLWTERGRFMGGWVKEGRGDRRNRRGDARCWVTPRTHHHKVAAGLHKPEVFLGGFSQSMSE